MRSGTGTPSPLPPPTVHLAFFDAMREDPRAAREHAAAAAAFCKENSIFLRQVEAGILHGWAVAETGDAGRGVSETEAAFDVWRQLGAQICDSCWYMLLAKAYVCTGRLPQARDALDAAFRAANANGEHILSAELHRIDGELQLASSGTDEEAERCFHAAIEVARRQKAKLWEVRGATSLARLWQRQGKVKRLAIFSLHFYAWFTEGFDTKDLKDAKALLEELG